MLCAKVCLHIQEPLGSNPHYLLRVNLLSFEGSHFLTNSGFQEVARLHFTCKSLQVNEQLNRYGLHLVTKPLKVNMATRKHKFPSFLKNRLFLEIDKASIPSPHSQKWSRLSFHVPQTQALLCVNA